MVHMGFQPRSCRLHWAWSLCTSITFSVHCRFIFRYKFIFYLPLLTCLIAGFFTSRFHLSIYVIYPIASKYNLLFRYGGGKLDHFVSTFSFSLLSGGTSSPSEQCKSGLLSLTFHNNIITWEHGGRQQRLTGKVFTVAHSQPWHSISDIAASSPPHNKKTKVFRKWCTIKAYTKSEQPARNYTSIQRNPINT